MTEIKLYLKYFYFQEFQNKIVSTAGENLKMISEKKLIFEKVL